MNRQQPAAARPGAIVQAVRPGSIAEEAGLGPGDRIVAVNGRPPQDLIQFHFAAASDHLALTVEKPDGTLLELEMEKDEEEDLGLTFTDPLFDRIVTCVNHCIFCFVHQSPRRMRSTLYVMDDDLRLSVMDGNFITLTNWTEADWQRVFQQHLSPLYISVHTTDDDLRAFLMGTPKARGIMGHLQRLAEAGIVMHTQVVLCPGINDGPHLERSVLDLATLYPQVRTVAVVPVGLTRFRRALYPLRPYTPAEARAVLDRVHRWQRDFLDRLGSRLIFAADEWYVLADRPVPPAAAYEDFPQLDNGIGLIRRLLEEARSAWRRLPPELPAPRRVLWVTGRSAAPTLTALARRIERRVAGLAVEVQAVENRFYGPTVTVAGLLTAGDIRDALLARDGLPAFDAVYLPQVALKPDAPLFLDDVTLAELQAATTPRLQALPVNGRALVLASAGVATRARPSLPPRKPTAWAPAGLQPAGAPAPTATTWAPGGSAGPRPARRSRPGWAP